MLSLQEQLALNNQTFQTPAGAPINYEIVPNPINLKRLYQFGDSVVELYKKWLANYGLNFNRDLDRLVWLQKEETAETTARGIQYAGVPETVWGSFLAKLAEISKDPIFIEAPTQTNIIKAAVTLLANTIEGQLEIVTLPEGWHRGRLPNHETSWLGISHRAARRLVGYVIDKGNYQFKISVAQGTNLSELEQPSVCNEKNWQLTPNLAQDGKETALAFAKGAQPDLLINADDKTIESQSVEQSFKDVSLCSQAGYKLNEKSRQHPSSALLPFKELADSLTAMWPEPLKGIPNMLKSLPAIETTALPSNYISDRLLSDPATQERLLG